MDDGRPAQRLRLVFAQPFAKRSKRHPPSLHLANFSLKADLNIWLNIQLFEPIYLDHISAGVADAYQRGAKDFVSQLPLLHRRLFLRGGFIYPKAEAHWHIKRLVNCGSEIRVGGFSVCVVHRQNLIFPTLDAIKKAAQYEIENLADTGLIRDIRTTRATVVPCTELVYLREYGLPPDLEHALLREPDIRARPFSPDDWDNATG
jgi:hypothetical protein